LSKNIFKLCDNLKKKMKNLSKKKTHPWIGIPGERMLPFLSKKSALNWRPSVPRTPL
jgi:hypothetical protein